MRKALQTLDLAQPSPVVEETHVPARAPLAVVRGSAAAGAGAVPVAAPAAAARPAAVWRARPSAARPPTPPVAADVRGPFAWSRPRRALLIFDLTAAVAGALVAGSVLTEAVWGGPLPVSALYAHGVAVGVGGLITVLLNTWARGYSSRRRLSRVDDSLMLTRGVVLAATVATAIALVTHGFGAGFTAYSRTSILAGYLVLFCLMGAARLATWWWQRSMFLRGEGVRYVVLAGTGASAHAFERFLQTRRWLGVRCAGAVDVLGRATQVQRHGGLPLAVPVLGTVGDVERVLRAVRADEVVVALDDDELPAFPGLARALAAAGVPFRVMPTVFEAAYRHARAAGLDGLPTVDVRVEFLDEVQRAVKRIFDVAVALASLALLAPLLLVIALLVKLTSPGPVFFRQERVGKDGRRFEMLKFRSMYADAEARLGGLLHLNEADGALFKLRDDPRVTPLGRVLRRWSIDELPQFINVLRGEMSVVGPRPPLPREVEDYETAHLARLKGKPGITGLWQVSGRSDLTFAQMVDLDRYYLEHWSLGLDLGIMLRTALAIVRRTGAY